MGRRAAGVKAKREGQFMVARFWHPLEKKMIRCPLGTGDAADDAERFLNLILLDPEHRIPDKCPQCVLDAWGTGIPHAEKDKTNSDMVPRALYEAALVENASLREGLEAAHNRIRVLTKQAEVLSGRKLRKGACPTLAEAAAQFCKSYKTRDRQHTANVHSLINSFATHFDYGRLEVDALDGREDEICAFIYVDTAGAAQRHWRRTYILKFLKHAGLGVDKERFPVVSSTAIKRERGAIHWLSREDAIAVAEKLLPYWATMFRVQVGIGVRPTELVTLKRSDFTKDLSVLTLTTIPDDEDGEFNLKTGSRKIQVPEVTRKLIADRLKLYGKERPGDLVFPNPRTNKAWFRRRWFFRKYKSELEEAATLAKVHTPMDSRIGRRTCASILLRSNRPDGKRYSVEDVAAILGDDPETIRKHYASIISSEVDPTAAAI